MKRLLGVMLLVAACFPLPDLTGKACDATHPCGDGFECAMGACCAAPCTLSMGDAGRVDAGSSADAGVDAGTSDAGEVDAGLPLDSGVLPDAGPPDAGPPDAGPPDAGVRDAGAFDAGVFDAGVFTNLVTNGDFAQPDSGRQWAFLPASHGSLTWNDGGWLMATRFDGGAPVGIQLTFLRIPSAGKYCFRARARAVAQGNSDLNLFVHQQVDAGYVRLFGTSGGGLPVVGGVTEWRPIGNSIDVPSLDAGLFLEAAVIVNATLFEFDDALVWLSDAGCP